jgi:hypothetical protein
VRQKFGANSGAGEGAERSNGKEQDMATDRTQSAVLGDLLRLSDALTENADDLQMIGGAVTELDAIVQQAKEAASRQAAATATKLVATDDLNRLLREGSRLATALRQQVKYRYGISSPKLAEFGMQPFRGRKKATPVEPEPELENPDGTPIEITTA